MLDELAVAIGDFTGFAAVSIHLLDEAEIFPARCIMAFIRPLSSKKARCRSCQTHACA